MVSKFTTPFQVHGPQSVVDPQLLDDLSYKQAKFDEGYLQISNTLQSYNSLDLIRPEDIQYRNNKVAQLTEHLNSYGNQDLSNVKVAAQLTIDAKSLSTDKDLIGKIQSTKNYRQLVDRYNKMKENPKLLPYYSDVNEWRDMKEASQWLTGQSSTMTKSSPTLKVDTDKILGDMMAKIAPTITSTPNGMYMVEKQMRTQNDLKRSTMDKISSDSSIRSQLMANSEYLYKDQTPDTIINSSIERRMKSIDETKESISQYKIQLLDATTSKEDKSSIDERIKYLENEVLPEQQKIVDNLKSSALKGDYSQASSEAYMMYLDTYADSVTRPYIVDKTKVTPNQVAMFREKNMLHSQEVSAKMQQERDLNAIDWDNKFKLQAMNNEAQLKKAGLTTDGNGNLISGSNGAYFQLPAIDENTKEVNAISEITTKSTRYKNENRNIMSQMVEEILEKTDRTLLNKLQPLLRNPNGANIFDNNGKYLGDNKGLSKAEIDLFKQYDYLLDNATNPSLLKDNPLLNGYAKYSNALIENQTKWEALDNETLKAQKEVFEESRKSGEFKGDWNSFIKTLEGEIKAASSSKLSKPTDLFSSGQQFGVQSSKTEYSGQKFRDQINSKLNKSNKVLNFKTGVSIATEDKIFNDPSSKVNQNLRTHIIGVDSETGGTGVIIDGKTWAINGGIAGGVAVRDKIDGITDIKVTSIIPNTNQMYVDLYGKDGKGNVVVKRGKVQFNPDQFNNITGYVAPRSADDFSKSLTNGAMVDSKGNPRYFNLAGDIPDMKANIKYRVFKSGEDELLLNIVTVLPNGKEREVIVPKELIGELKGTNALQDARSRLSTAYIDARRIVAKKNPSITSLEELEKLTLSEFYKNFK